MSFETDVAAFASGINAEMPLRLIVFRGDIATGNPKSSTQALINGAPQGSLYLEKDTTPLKTWQKQGPGALQWSLISGSFGSVPTSSTIAITSSFLPNEGIDITTGSGETSGTSTLSGDAFTIPSDYLTNKIVDFFLNGVRLEKGISVSYSSNKLRLLIALDPGDRIVIKSEESL